MSGDDNAPLLAAIDRLSSFRDSWEAGDQIDEASHLTADDLDVLLEHCRRTKDVVTIRQINLGDMGRMAQSGDI